MKNYDDEQRAMDIALEDQHTGSALQALGWVLLAFAAIPAVWIWVGFRSGSYFWLYWTVGEGALGCGLLAAGTMLRARSARNFGRVGSHIQAASMPEAEKARQQERTDEAA